MHGWLQSIESTGQQVKTPKCGTQEGGEGEILIIFLILLNILS